MATINHSSGADIIVPSNNGTTYRGLGGDDTYIFLIPLQLMRQLQLSIQVVQIKFS